MKSSFVVGNRYRVYGETFKTIRVISRTAKTVTVQAGREKLSLRVKVNPYHEPENVGVEYVDLGEGTTVENYVPCDDVV